VSFWAHVGLNIQYCIVSYTKTQNQLWFEIIVISEAIAKCLRHRPKWLLLVCYVCRPIALYCFFFACTSFLFVCLSVHLCHCYLIWWITMYRIVSKASTSKLVSRSSSSSWRWIEILRAYFATSSANEIDRLLLKIYAGHRRANLTTEVSSSHQPMTDQRSSVFIVRVGWSVGLITEKDWHRARATGSVVTNFSRQQQSTADDDGGQMSTDAVDRRPRVTLIDRAAVSITTARKERNEEVSIRRSGPRNTDVDTTAVFLLLSCNEKFWYSSMATVSIYSAIYILWLLQMTMFMFII